MADDRAKWDRRYAAALAEGVPDRPPAAWVQANEALIDAQPRGQALEIGCGLGFNALYLAELGFGVDAVDISGVAVGELARRARARGLPVRAQRLDLAVDALPGSGYRVVVCTYFLERSLLAPVQAALAPGGLLLYETYADGGRWAFAPGELRTAFSALAVIAYREGAYSGRPVASLAARA